MNKSPSGKPGAVHNAGDPRAWITDPLAGIPGYTITKVDDLVPWRWNGELSEQTVKDGRRFEGVQPEQGSPRHQKCSA